MTLASKRVLVYDHGLYPYLAQKLGENFGQVLYYVPIADPYPKSPKAQIGCGLPEIERVYSLWDNLEKVDAIIFFDVYDGQLQRFLRKKGYRVFGSGVSDEIETDKQFFREMLLKVGLPTAPCKAVKGLSALEAYLEEHKDKWLKTSYYRGDFETYHHLDLEETKCHFLDDLRARLGARGNEIEVLVEDPIEADCEVGYDGFCVNGEHPANGAVGYEIKDQGIVEKIFPTLPKILADVNVKMAPVYKKLGYQGCYSTEIRITSKGEPYFIDPCCRAASPPSELLCELYENYAEAVWEISGGEVPELEPADKYGAEIILSSPWHEQHELCFELPKDLVRWVKLKDHSLRGDKYYCVPNDNAGIFGAVVAIGSTLKEATELAMDRVRELKVYQMDFDQNLFSEVAEQVKKGEKFEIKF